VLPLYIVEQRIDPATLGVILAAWPAARLVTEPIFGWVADRTARRPLMVAGMALIGLGALLPIFFPRALELLLLRALAGIGAGMYEPSARGYIVDATREGERGEAFGLYQAAVMAGIVVGPGIAALGAQVWPGYTLPFVVGGLLCFAATAYLGFALRPGAAVGDGIRSRGRPFTETSFAEYGTDSPEVAERMAERFDRDRRPSTEHARSLLNRPLVGAVVMNMGLYSAVGVYEVVWSLYMRGLGASVSWIGVTFVLFGLPTLVLAPLGGRIVDRLGGLRFAVLGGLAVAAFGYVYTLATEPVFPAVVGIGESSVNAFLGPAMYAILATGIPPGRSSTAQGMLRAAGTLAFIVASVVAGRLLDVDVRYPFYYFAIVTGVLFVAGWLIVRGVGSRARDEAPQAAPV